MTFLHQGRFTLGVAVAVAILTGCGGSQPPIGTPNATQPESTRMQHQNTDAKGGPEVLYSFAGSPDGAQPWSGIAFNRDNPNVPSDIGTTLRGGDSNNDGTVYGLTPGKKGAWNESVLYTFSGYPNDGSEPTGTVNRIRKVSPAGVVTTIAGGTSNNGTVVELTSTSSGPWTESFIYSFKGTPDGANPYGDLLVDKQNNVYGTTSAGGTDNAGTVYRMSPKGSSFTETVLYSFQSGTDGDQPNAGLILEKGVLYGTTIVGGSSGYGTVFKSSPSKAGQGGSFYSFQGPPNDGSRPHSCLNADSHGALYGTTSEGGTQNLGTVYKLTPNGSSYTESVLWNFGSISGDGAYPLGSLGLDSKGDIYGTTSGGGSGGSSGYGTFFILAPSGSTYRETVYGYAGTDGAYPYAGPSADSKGNVYVTTEGGGTKNNGSVSQYLRRKMPGKMRSATC